MAIAISRFAQVPPGYRYSLGRILAIYSGLMATILVAALDQFIVATALPHIVADIGGVTSYSWAFTGYLLCQTVSIPLYGRLGDMRGRRPVLLGAISVFLLGSALCGLAQNMNELIVFRCVQGAGAGGLIPLVHATIAHLIPPRDRGRYQGLTSAAFSTAAISGPTVGGLIVDHASWRWIFYANLPVGGIALLVVMLTMPREEPGPKQPVDVLGALLLGGATALGLLALVWGGVVHPWTSPAVLGALATGVAMLALFALQERRVAETILPFQALRNRTVAAGATCMGLASMCQFGAIAFVPLFVQAVIGTSATASGIVLTPMAIGAALMSFASGQWISRSGHYRANALAGPIVLAVGMFLLWHLGVDSSRGVAIRDMFVCGLGMGLMMPVFVVASQNATPLRMLTSTTAFLQFSRALGTTLGVTLFGAIVSHELPSGFDESELSQHLSTEHRFQLAHAIKPGFLVATCICVLMFVVAAVGVKASPLRRTLDEQPA